MLSICSKRWRVKYNLQEDNVQSPSDNLTLESVLFLLEDNVQSPSDNLTLESVLLIQIHKTYEVWEFENTFGLGCHCEGFVPGMIVAFKPNNETGIILDYKYTY
jgi:hypothetical protein